MDGVCEKIGSLNYGKISRTERLRRSTVFMEKR